MEKGDAVKYLVIVLVFAGLAAIVLVLRPSPTGYIIQEFAGDFNETECAEEPQGWWYNYSGIEYGCYDLSLANESECGDLEAHLWSDGTCNVEEECIPEENSITCGNWVCGTKTNNCGEDIPCGDCFSNETCEEGICIENICNSEHLNFCNETTCRPIADGYWYNGVCNADCSGDLSTCRDESGCISASGYWDNVVGVCNANECDDDDDCDSGLVCTTDNVCCAPQTCSDLGKECGTGWDDGCEGTVDCDEDCASDETCDDDGICVEESSSSSSSSETTEEEGKNLELSGQDKVLVSAGSSEEAELHVVNVGKYQLSCEVANENWISSEEKIEYLNKEEEIDIKYIVSVPTGTSAGDYSKELILKCTGGISESKIIDVTVIAGEGSITGDVIAEELEAKPGITGFVVGAGRGRVIAYVVFLLVLAGAVILVWKRHAQIKGLDDLLFRGKEWFNNKFHKGK